jgi:hypothetical protein
MNEPTLIRPCADYEHELVELHEGVLAPERARVVRLHLAQCARCRRWAADFAALDAQLAAELPHPALSPGFEARLAARIATLDPGASRGRTRTADELEREHDSLVLDLLHRARRRALLGAIGSAAATACAFVTARNLLAGRGELVALLPEGPERWLALGALGVTVAAGALAWSAARNLLPLPGFAR